MFFGEKYVPESSSRRPRSPASARSCAAARTSPSTGQIGLAADHRRVERRRRPAADRGGHRRGGPPSSSRDRLEALPEARPSCWESARRPFLNAPRERCLARAAGGGEGREGASQRGYRGWTPPPRWHSAQADRQDEGDHRLATRTRMRTALREPRRRPARDDRALRGRRRWRNRRQAHAARRCQPRPRGRGIRRRRDRARGGADLRRGGGAVRTSRRPVAGTPIGSTTHCARPVAWRSRRSRASRPP